LVFRNCSNEAQQVVFNLEKNLNDLKGDVGGELKPRQSMISMNLMTSTPDIKSIVFKLKNYLSVDYFAEEFISYEGIKFLIEIIRETTGNTRVRMNSFTIVICD
jgi:hypothetical protein